VPLAPGVYKYTLCQAGGAVSLNGHATAPTGIGPVVEVEGGGEMCFGLPVEGATVGHGPGRVSIPYLDPKWSSQLLYAVAYWGLLFLPV
jgi:hypothetical protein